MDATSNLDRNDSKIFHLMCPSPLGGLSLGTFIPTRANESTLSEALELYKTILPENAFYGRGKVLGPKLAITDDDSAERNSLKIVWPRLVLLLCFFHLLQAVWSWLWKREHDNLKNDIPVLFNLIKRIVYAESTEEYDRVNNTMEENEFYQKYDNFKAHAENKILPRYEEWSLK